MTQEEKAKAYDEALERARKLKENPQSVFNEYSPKEGDTICDYIFPELKESEDERIRKEIIKFLELPHPQFVGKRHQEEWIVWLEKQGNPTNKVEPKFKKGDWLVHNERKNIIKVVNPTPLVYEVVDILGYHHTITDTAIENNYHLWTIQDVKDGDVVVDKSDGAIGIFQGILHHPNGGSCNNPSYCFLYCRYNGFFYAYLEHGNTTSSDDLIPATEEQRDLLFLKMKESGYEWDAEKKELKKIEQKPTQETEPFEAEHGKYYYCIKDYFCGGRKQASKGDVVQALRGLPIMGLKDASEYFLPVNSIKCNTAWSEEDESLRLRTIGALETCKIGSPTKCVNEQINWLKSLKDRYTWKPSDEQMEALEQFMLEYKDIDDNNRAYPISHIIESLCDDLKKLKGE